jgi:hypothetical protein
MMENVSRMKVIRNGQLWAESLPLETSISGWKENIKMNLKTG